MKIRLEFLFHKIEQKNMSFVKKIVVRG